MIFPLDNAVARKIGSFSPGTRIPITVKTAAATIYLASTRAEVEVTGAGGVRQGIEILQAQGTVEITWTGELWAIASAASVQVDFRI